MFYTYMMEHVNDSHQGPSTASTPTPQDRRTDLDELWREADNLTNPYERPAKGYTQLRPDYTRGAVDQICTAINRSRAHRSTSSISVNSATQPINFLDLGSGDGSLICQIAQALSTPAPNPPSTTRSPIKSQTKPILPFISFYAVEPSQEMNALASANPCIEAIVDNPHFSYRTHAIAAEAINDLNVEADIVTAAQSWHWLDEQAMSGVLGKTMRPGGDVFIMYNQLNVDIPWIKRLTRISRSGDVHRPWHTPYLGDGFSAPDFFAYSFGQWLHAEEILQLARTRSSYLKASDQGKIHMQNNLRWYLYDYMGFDPEEPIELPYTTLLWHAYKL